MEDEPIQARHRLLIMRHAKSSWSSSADTDHARPLNNRGRRDAPRMAETLIEMGWVPELVLSSDAQRTRETWEGMREHFTTPITTIFNRTLYHAGLPETAALLRSYETQVQTILVLGHNPGWHAMVAMLSGEDGHKMTTANIALLSHAVVEPGGWATAIEDRGGWQLHDVLRPKELKRQKRKG
ncbi:MAG: histidine phosphatase family protein [Myxococcota bacterium]